MRGGKQTPLPVFSFIFDQKAKSIKENTIPILCILYYLIIHIYDGFFMV